MLFNFTPYFPTKNGSMDAITKLANESRVLTFIGVVNSTSAAILINSLLVLDGMNDNEITILINSTGGCVYSGFAIYDTIRNLRSKVKVVVLGLAASAAALITISADKREMSKNGTIMIHQPMSKFSGNASQLTVNTEEINEIKLTMKKMLIERCTIPKKMLERMLSQDVYLRFDEAIKYGIVYNLTKSLKNV